MPTLTNAERTNQLFLLQDKITDFGRTMERVMLELGGAEALASLVSEEHEEIDHKALGLPDLPELDIDLFEDIPFRDAVVYWLSQSDSIIGKSYVTILLSNLNKYPNNLASAHAGATMAVTAFLWQQFDMALKFACVSRKIAEVNGSDMNLSELVINATLELYGNSDDGDDFIEGLKETLLDSHNKEEMWAKYFEIEIPDTPNL